MAEKKEDKRSTRTKMLDEEYEKKPGIVTGLGRMLSRAGDAVGFTQEEEYKDKSFAEVKTIITAYVRDEKIATLRTKVFEDLRMKYLPKVNQVVLAKLLIENKEPEEKNTREEK